MSQDYNDEGDGEIIIRDTADISAIKSTRYMLLLTYYSSLKHIKSKRNLSDSPRNEDDGPNKQLAPVSKAKQTHFLII